ncbi:hypothetical protein [Streptomyces anulatus]|uniref:Uncharacterized protein n=1 Tax=Streptomyces anulatus TaxID=1892 RepID=A0A7K3RCY9_STRAQ|nr:hypothetical protein [Streptomyces anulatus]NEB99915.1 hypothetical protein [Streptomyces anulatus]NED25152.1 hypothetical protein [Streptomyces anulatus]
MTDGSSPLAPDSGAAPAPTPTPSPGSPPAPAPASGRGQDPDARRRSRRRALLLLLLLLLLATGVLLWFFNGPGSDDGSGDDSNGSPRGDLTRAAALLRDAPALHYTGTMAITGAEGGEDARVDLIVSNPADALGTLRMPDRPALDYVGIDGRSFLRGNTEAWQSLGMAEKSKVLAKNPSMVQPGMFFSQDLATTLAPPALAKTVAAEDVPDEKITVGKPITVGDHTCTPFHIDDTTVCLSDERVDGARFVDRVTFPGGSAVLDIKALSRQEVERFSTDFRSKLPLIRDAVDPRIKVTNQMLRDYKGACAPTACVFTTRVTVMFLGTTSDPDASKPVPVTYSWAIDRDGTPVEVDPECSGTLLIKPGESEDLSCTGTGPSVGSGASRGQYTGKITISDRALTPKEYDRLVNLAVDNSEKIAALPDLPTA